MCAIFQSLTPRIVVDICRWVNFGWWTWTRSYILQDMYCRMGFLYEYRYTHHICFWLFSYLLIRSFGHAVIYWITYLLIYSSIHLLRNLLTSSLLHFSYLLSHLLVHFFDYFRCLLIYLLTCLLFYLPDSCIFHIFIYYRSNVSHNSPAWSSLALLVIFRTMLTAIPTQVDNGYVLKKIKVLLLPIFKKDWYRLPSEDEVKDDVSYCVFFSSLRFSGSLFFPFEFVPPPERTQMQDNW